MPKSPHSHSQHILSHPFIVTYHMLRLAALSPSGVTIKANFSKCCCLFIKPCLTLCDPMDQSTPGHLSSTVSQGLVKFMLVASMTLSNHLALCHPLLAFTPSQHQDLFQGVFFSHEMAKVLEPQLQDLSFQ